MEQIRLLRPPKTDRSANENRSSRREQSCVSKQWQVRISKAGEFNPTFPISCPDNSA